MQETDQPQPSSESDLPQKSSAPVSSRYSYYALIVLSLLNLLNYVDRFIFAALVPYIQEEMKFTKTEIGYFSGAFTIVYTILSPVYGYFADRRARASLISSGIAIWSIATALGGVAQNFWHMIVARSAVGIGEASYATISPGFLSDYFEVRKRGFAFGIFFAAVPLGQALGFIVGGKLGAPEMLGWRQTLFLVGAPGIAMALFAHFLREPERGKFDPIDPKTGHGSHGKLEGSLIEGYKTIGRSYSYVTATLGYSAITFSLGALSFWAPLLLKADKGLQPETATAMLGIFVTLGGLIGTIAGGWMGDQLLRRMKGGYFLLCALSSLLASIPLVAALTAQQESIIYGAVFLTVLLVFLGNGPVNAIVVNSVPPNLRATAVATTILSIHFLGDALSQPLVGIISDWITERANGGLALPSMIAPIADLLGLTAQKSLSIALLITPAALVVAAFFFFLGLRSKK